MKKLLSKGLMLSLSGLILFTACEDEDAGLVNGKVVGKWQLTSYSAKYERMVKAPAGTAAGTRYKHMLAWDGDGNANTDGYIAAVGGAAAIGGELALIDVTDGDVMPGFEGGTSVSFANTAELTALGVNLTLTTEDAPGKNQGATYKVEGTYPTVRFDAATCQSTITVAPITDQGLYISDYDTSGIEKLGNFMIAPDINLGGAVLAPFQDGSYSIKETPGAQDVVSIDYLDRDGHDVKYAEVKTVWDEADDRVIQGYNLVYNDANGYIARSDPNPAVLNANKTGGYVLNPAIPASYSSTYTWFFHNLNVATAGQATDIKNPLTDLDKDGKLGPGDMVVYMHYDNLAGGGGRTPFGILYTSIVDSSNPAAPKPVNDSATKFDGADPNKGGRMYFKVKQGVCVPANELITIASNWTRIVE